MHRKLMIRPFLKQKMSNKNRLTYVLSMVLILAGCGTHSVGDDLQLICQKLEEINRQPGLSKEEKSLLVYDTLSNLELSYQTKRFLSNLGHKETVSYRDFEEFAAEMKTGPWECEVLKEMLE